MSALLAAALAAGAAAAWPRPAAEARHRLSRVAGPARAGAGGRAEGRRHRRHARAGGASPSGGFSRPLAAALGGLGVAGLVGGVAGLAAGLLAGVGLAAWLGRLEPAATRERRLRSAADLGGALDLVAACLLAGAPPPEALGVAAAAVGGPVGEDLSAARHALLLGVPLRAVAGPTGREGRAVAPGAPAEALAALARALERAAVTGASLATVVAAAATEHRAAHHAAAVAKARRVGVAAVAPLGLCFLPAFVLAAVVPVIAGLLHGVVATLP